MTQTLLSEQLGSSIYVMALGVEVENSAHCPVRLNGVVFN
jgi:hypothetical protein